MRRLFPVYMRPTGPAAPLSKHPYRHAAVTHAVLAAVLVAVSLAVSTSLGRTVLVAGGYFLAATAWTWWRLRERIRREAAAKAAE
jgi:threonine/homoserine/homoserine lactone efflux protein